MKATRHNGRSGKHGTYDAKHNDRRFDVENSEHIDAERTKMNVYWDCYQGNSLPNDKDARARFTFTEIEKAYYVEKYSDHVRHVFDAVNQYGELCLQQDKALEELDFELPKPNEKKGKYNNRKMVL